MLLLLLQPFLVKTKGETEVRRMQQERPALLLRPDRKLKTCPHPALLAYILKLSLMPMLPCVLLSLSNSSKPFEKKGAKKNSFFAFKKVYRRF